MRRNRRVKKPSYRRNILIALGAILITVFVGSGIYAAVLYHKANSAIDKMGTHENPSSNSASASGNNTDDGNPGITKPVTFLLTAVDNRNDGANNSMNTDVMMIVALDPKTQTATMLSLPRDLRLNTKDITPHKINYYYSHFYAQDKDTAITKTKELFSDMFQIPIDYMAVIDFKGFRDVVDELGGVTVDVDMDMRYVDNEDGTNIDLKAGIQKLDGKNALDFVRYRKSNMGTAESSDFARNDRQQAVLSELLDKMTSLGGITKWGGLLDIAGENVRTDIPVSQIHDWIKSFRKLKPNTMESTALVGDWISPYVVPKEEDLVKAVDGIRARLGLPLLADANNHNEVLAANVNVSGSKSGSMVASSGIGNSGSSSSSKSGGKKQLADSTTTPNRGKGAEVKQPTATPDPTPANEPEDQDGETATSPATSTPDAGVQPSPTGSNSATPPSTPTPTVPAATPTPSPATQQNTQPSTGASTGANGGK
ncbi:LCP family protein [Gorillibacterium massiliense]|uniref:LCP family protein n=1 Tax=Gorillibacterium massiliense TaxID=1280390 RepID=UPI0004B19F0E|nr:LCP family protein [Gorillibacterium massiliense]